jgi:DNA excision repair protein ERCC-2
LPTRWVALFVGCEKLTQQRFARQDKRSKLPRWINQYITDAHSNLSTDMAVVLAKKFIRQISQPFDHTQTGISLWTLEDIEERQRKDREDLERAAEEMDDAFGPTTANGAAGGARIDDADVEMDHFDIDDAALAAVDFPEDV